MTPAIVVITHDRPGALRRLLSSLDAADYSESGTVPLVISIDGGESGGHADLVELANSFQWRFGTKQVIAHPEHLGLVNHFRSAGRLSQDYEAIVLLEDDLTVAPPFYRFASQALENFTDEVRIGGICLYDLWFNGYTRLPFRSLDDGFDAYFIQVPFTQGLGLSAGQWQRFDDWWQRNGPTVKPHRSLHDSFMRFGEDEWLPVMAAYLAQEERYFCFPHSALSTAWGDPGVHFGTRTNWFLAPVQLRNGDFRLPNLDDSLSVYDSFFELTPQRLRVLAPNLPLFEFDVDLNATKLPSNLRHDYVLTTRPVRKAVSRFGLRLQPLELNVIQNVPGDEIGLASVEDVYWDRWAGLEAQRRLDTLAWSKRRPSHRRDAAFLLARSINRARQAWDAARGREM